MFHLGFRSTAKTIAALESQISFHVRGPKASECAEGRQRGQMAVQKWQKATLLIFLYKGALMCKQLYRGWRIAQSAAPKPTSCQLQDS